MHITYARRRIIQLGMLAVLASVFGCRRQSAADHSAREPTLPSQFVPVSAPVASATLHDKSVILTEPAVAGSRFGVEIDLSLLYPDGGIFRCDIVHETNLDGHRYFVLDVEAVSRPGGNGMGECGSGTEAGVVWVHVGKEWLVEDAQLFRYESCWANLSGTVKAEADRITVTWSNLRNEDTRAVFDRHRPENGFATDAAKTGK